MILTLQHCIYPLSRRMVSQIRHLYHNNAWDSLSCSLLRGLDICCGSAGFYLGFIVRGRSTEWPKATQLPRGVREHAPPDIFWNEYALRCNLVHFETQFWEMCTDLVASGWFFRYSYLYSVMITIFLWGKLGILGGKLLPLKFPKNIHPLPLPHGGYFCFSSQPPGISAIFQLCWVPPGKNISV